MRILVDESLPRQLANELPDHQVSTVRAQRWLGLKNGVLLRAAVDAGFEVFITADQSVEFQQMSARRDIAVIVVLVRNRMQDIRRILPQVFLALTTIEAGQTVKIAG